MASVSTSAANATRIHHVPSTKVLPVLPPTTTTFSFGVPAFQITTTRALLSGTDFATLGIVVTRQDVDYEAAASPPAVRVPDLLSMDPDKVAHARSEVGLVGHETGPSKGNVDVPQVVTQSPLPGWLTLTGGTVDYNVHVPDGGRDQAP